MKTIERRLGDCRRFPLGIVLAVLLAQYPVPPMRVEPDPTPPPPRPGYIYQPPIYVEPLPWNNDVPYAPRYQIVQPGTNRPPSYVSPLPNGSVQVTQPDDDEK
jgi:hypothetical protein